MGNFLFSVNATMPVFFVMMLGVLFRRIGLIDEAFASGMNRFVFKIALPVSLFTQLCDVDFREVWDTGYVVFCFGITLLSVLVAVALSFVFRDKEVRGEFVQGSFRSSASLLGMTYIENIYGEATLGSLMMLGCVPLYNVMAVLVLSLMRPGSEGVDRKRLKAALKGIVTNPIIWGILLGFAWGMIGITLPNMVMKTTGYIGRLASPMGLLAMGAQLNFHSLGEKLPPVFLGTFMKLIGFTALFIPHAVFLGFRGEKLLAVLIMLGSASTVAGYIMAKNMGHEGTVSAGCVVLSTLLSSLTLTIWIWILRFQGLI
ncbi:MAG: AEC family transporter [Eubacterium sp.]|uniref:Putative permease n=1 Tax=Eubacterium cellulosolvens (strain ATCC 43171 / JCM 9499 / 6) TaxID=633697 RepID=I5ATP0_EUBC6|nr:AEC family transporter [Eubacterium sp.]